MLNESKKPCYCDQDLGTCAVSNLSVTVTKLIQHLVEFR